MTKAYRLIASIRESLFATAGGAGDVPAEVVAGDMLRKSIDAALNALQLRESPSFFLNHLRLGQALLQEGLTIVASARVGDLAVCADNTHCHEGMHADVLEAEIRALRGRLSIVVDALDESRSDRERRYLDEVSEWESGYYKHFLESAPRSARGTLLSRARLQEYLVTRFPDWGGLEVNHFLALEGGFSKNTILFETTDARNGRQSFVMRAEQATDLLCYDGSDVTHEFHLIEFMKRQGLPIAEPLWLESDASRLGFRFIVSRKVEGRIFGGALGSTQPMPPALLKSLMSTFVKLHGIEVDPRDASLQRSHLKEWLPFAASLDQVTQYHVTEYLPRIIRRTRMGPSPQINRCLKWLGRNIPHTDEAPVIIHGDFSFNNLLIDNDQVAAVLDWESSRLSDPAEDIIWTQQNLAPHLDMPTFLAQYNAATGRHVTEARLAYHRVSKCVLNATTCLSAAHILETSPAANINLALLAYQYMGLFGAEFNRLIAQAERTL